MFTDYEEVDLHDICESIKALLTINPKNWALAQRSSLAAQHYANMYAAATQHRFNDLNRMSDRAQAKERNILVHADAAARKEALKNDPAALARSLVCLGVPESTEDLSNEPIKPNRKRANFSDAKEDRDAKVARLAEKAKNGRKMTQKAEEISPANRPLMTDNFRNTAMSAKLRAGMGRVYASYLEIRQLIANVTTKFEPYYKQFLAVVEQVMAEEYWQPRFISVVAVKAIRDAMLLTKGRRPEGPEALQQGHGTRATTLAQSQFLRRLLREGEVETLEDVGKYLTQNNETCMITKAQNDVDAQLGPDEMLELPAGRRLFCRAGRACKFGQDEIACRGE